MDGTRGHQGTADLAERVAERQPACIGGHLIHRHKYHGKYHGAPRWLRLAGRSPDPRFHERALAGRRLDQARPCKNRHLSVARANLDSASLGRLALVFR